MADTSSLSVIYCCKQIMMFSVFIHFSGEEERGRNLMEVVVCFQKIEAKHLAYLLQQQKSQELGS